MWGFWAIEWKGAFHIYYLEDVDANYDLLSWQKRHDHIGHAVSTDLVHWQARPSLCVRGEPGTWNDMAAGGGAKSGCVVEHDGKFYMFVGAAQKDGVQVVGVWLSDDLDTWNEHPDNPVLKPAGPHYRHTATRERPSVGWRDPGILYCREDGYYHMVISAQTAEQSRDRHLGTTIGHLRSRDLMHWEYLPPVETPGLWDRFYQVEEPEMFELAGKYYLLLEGGTTGGMRTSTPGRDDARGTFYMTGETCAGPFARPTDDLLIGNGHGARCATTSRVIPRHDTRLCLHFVIARRPLLGSPKTIGVWPDGTLHLEYMPVLEGLETGVLCDSIAGLPAFESPDAGRWRRSDGELSCDVKRGGTVYRVARDVADFHLSFTVKGVSAERVGAVVRICERGDAGVWSQGVGIVLDFAQQMIFFGDAKCYQQTGWFCKAIDTCRMPLERGRSYQLRCFVRGENLEIYLDNRWVFTAIIPESGEQEEIEVISIPRRHYGWGPKAAGIGAIELMAESGAAVFSDLRLAAIEPLI
jgi:beta-fructofuranosidase